MGVPIHSSFKGVKVENTSKSPLMILENPSADRDIPERNLVVERKKREISVDPSKTVIEIVAMLLCIITALGSFVGMVTTAKSIYNPYHSIGELDRNRLINSIYFLGSMHFLVKCYFSLILLKGLDTKQSKHLLACFVYEWLMITLHLTILFTAIFLLKKAPADTNLAVIVAAVVLHAVFLILVWDIYKKYDSRENREAYEKSHPVTRL